MNLMTMWTQHIPPTNPEGKAEFEKVVRNSSLALGRMKDIITSLEKTAEIPAMADYENAAWAYKQADLIGYRRGLRDIKKLLSFLDKE